MQDMEFCLKKKKKKSLARKPDFMCEILQIHFEKPPIGFFRLIGISLEESASFEEKAQSLVVMFNGL